MDLPKNILGSISPQHFLEEYWQKKPLLIRNAIPNFVSPIDPDELAGLACEKNSESRIIRMATAASDSHTRETEDPNSSTTWSVSSGPFKEEELSTLPDRNWSLLVHEVDTWVEEVNDIKECFGFIPNWRLDDVMVSFAPKGGTVGAHTDNYDVFLLQGLGSRNWKIGASPLSRPEIIPKIDLKLLKTFQHDQEFIMNPGDMLYLPPKFAHLGVATENSMTYSIGFRAPSAKEIFEAFLSHNSEALSEIFYQDKNIYAQENPAEITNHAIVEVANILRTLSEDPQEIRHWFGRLVSQGRREQGSISSQGKKFRSFRLLIQSLEQSHEQSHEQESLISRNELLHYAYSQSESGSVLLFINGEEYILGREALGFVKQLCQSKGFNVKDLEYQEETFAMGPLILELYSLGYMQ